MKRIILLMLTITGSLTLLFSVIAYGASGSNTGTVAESATVSNASQTSTTELRLPVDVTDLYTGGVNYDGNTKSNISGKAIYLGIICIFLFAGIVLICVKISRANDDRDIADDSDAKDGQNEVNDTDGNVYDNNNSDNDDD